MKRSMIATFVLGLAAGSAAPMLLNARDITRINRTAEKCAWPASLDAVAAAPRNHRVLMETDRVRVLDVTVAPGEREAVHAHCWPSVLYVMQQGRGRDYDAEGNLVEEALEAPPASEFPMTYWLDNSPPHAVENLDSLPLHLVRVELKQ